MKELNKDYTIELGRLDDQNWYNIMQQFEDANLYQTSSYHSSVAGLKNYSHLLIRKENKIVAAAQTRLMKLPVIKTGIAYALQGPMWRQNCLPEDPEIFRQTIRALRNEYSRRQGLVLRLFPIAFRGKDDHLKEILNDEGYRQYDDGKSHRTLIIDLAPSLQEIRVALDQKWRNCLNRAEKNNLEVIKGGEDSLFDEIKKIQMEMANRKGVKDLGDVEHLKKVQINLPSVYKLKAILCRLNGEIHAGAIFSAIGNTAVYLVGATSNTGMKSNGSYIIQWSFIKCLKENNFRYFDLNGINPEVNPGTYHFKHGLAGKKGMDYEYLGKFQVADNPLSAFVVNSGESLITSYKKALQRGRTLKNSINKKSLSK
jgi:hypothetical protein